MQAVPKDCRCARVTPSSTNVAATGPSRNLSTDPLYPRLMSRRPDPARIEAAKRAATLQRLIGEGELPDRAASLVAAWEAQAARDGLDRDGRYWETGWAWMQAQRPSR